MRYSNPLKQNTALTHITLAHQQVQINYHFLYF